MTKQENNYRPRDVVEVDFPFSDQSGSKARPALVISYSEYRICASEIVVLKITSSPSATCDTDVAIQEWQAAGLSKPSIVRCQPATIKLSRVLRKIGTLSEADWHDVQEAMQRAFCPQS